MALQLNLSKVTAVLLDSGWISTRRVEVTAVSGPTKWSSAVAIEDRDGGWVYAPMAAVRAFRLRERQLTPEEVADEQAAREAEADALFLYLTYAPSRAAFDEAVAKQGGMCAAGTPGLCGGDLRAAPIQHYRDGKVFCSMDSNMVLRAA